MKAKYIIIVSAIFLLASLHLSANEVSPFVQEQDSQNGRYVLQAIRVDKAPKIDGVLEGEIWQKAPAANSFVQKQPDEGKPATERTEVRILYDNQNVYIGIMCFDSEPHRIIANEKRRDSQNIYQNDHIQIMLDTFHDRRNGYIFVTNPLGAKLDLQVRKEGKKEGGSHIPNTNVNISWDGVWKVKSAIHQEGWSAEVEIPFATLRFDKSSREGWGLNFLRNVRRKNEESTWTPLPRNFTLYKISLAGTLEGFEGLKKVLNLQVKPYILVGNTSNRDEADILTSESTIDGGIDLKYGVTSNLTLDMTYNTEFSQVEADYQKINLTRFSLYFPEKRDFFLENAAIFSIGSPDDAMIFFSRRIGISSQGEEIPLLGAVKLAGKAGRFNIGFINLQAQEIGETPSNNFTVFRLGRDILEKSAIGFMVTNRQSGISGDYNRAYCVDGDFIFGENLSLSGYYALTYSPELDGRNRAAKLGLNWLSDLVNCYAYYFDIQENFNAEMGFVKRTGIRKFQTHFGITPEPDIKGVRNLDTHIYFSYNADQENNFILREEHIHMVVNFINGGHVAFQWNEDTEFVDFPFDIQKDITIPVDTYPNQYWQTDCSTNKSLRLYGSMSYRWGTFYGGYSHIINISTGWRPSPSFASELSLVYNDIDLPQGDFTNHILRSKLTYNFSTRLALMSLIQWNGETDEVDFNIRFNFIHKPGSDLFVVYNESRMIEGLPAGIRDRALVIKFTYLFNL